MTVFTALKSDSLKTEDRVNAFLDKFDKEENFTMADGKAVKLKKIDLN